MPFVGLRLVGDDHVSVALCPSLSGEFLEVGKGGDAVLGHLDCVGVEIGGDVEVWVCVGGEGDAVICFGPLPFKSDRSTSGGEGDQDLFW